MFRVVGAFGSVHLIHKFAMSNRSGLHYEYYTWLNYVHVCGVPGGLVGDPRAY